MSSINLKDLISQREALDKQIEETRKSQLKEVVEKIKIMIQENGLTPSDLFPVSAPADQKVRKVSKKVLPKYQDSQGNSWSGRGKSPKWLEGKDKASFLIPTESA